jgi:ATP-dependent helicase/nuclease subunit B
MPHLFTVPAGLPIADVAAKHILSALTREERPQAVVFVPTRRAAVTMRAAFQNALAGEASFLPRIVPLADSEQAVLSLLGEAAPRLLTNIPPAMPEWQHRYMLTAQVKRFLEQRHGVVTLDYALALADELIALQEQCARSGVTLTPAHLHQIASGNMAEHWEEALAFLGILAAHWPAVEAAVGMTISAVREVAVLHALTDFWCDSPPGMPVFAVGSTASQPSTAAFLQVIAAAPRGAVILPGWDSKLEAPEYQTIMAGHPLYHLRLFLERCAVAPQNVISLSLKEEANITHSVWLEASADAAQMHAWRTRPLPPYAHIRLVPCAHAESEARTIALILREALEVPGKRTALITPDEGLMDRVAAQMKRYGVTIDRLSRGTLRETDSASVWLLLLAALREPERLVHLRAFLHHSLVRVDPHFLVALEPYWYGTRPRRTGQLPKMADTVRASDAYHALEQLVRALPRLARGQKTASEWVVSLREILALWAPVKGDAAEAVEEALAALNSADILGSLTLTEFVPLMEERFSTPLRHGGLAVHPQLVMLTPVEARLEQFDRVILASMTDAVWPGMTPGNAWLNLAAQAALGLPKSEEQASLAAHDILMLASRGEVFMTWPARDKGALTTRSRYVERLETLLAIHGIESSSIRAPHYERWAEAAYHTEAFTPHPPIAPKPSASERPKMLPVSALDTLFEDPFSIYACYVLGLKELGSIDAELEASDFGSLAHKAIQALTIHWNTHARAAEQDELEAIAATALRDFSEHPSAALFWRSRLMRALAFVNMEEAARRELGISQVRSEVPIAARLRLAESLEMDLQGRIDRMEEGRSGSVIADYKSGDIPSEKEIREGWKLQLLAYAMLMEALPEAVEYWQLPHGRYAGEINRVAMVDLLENKLPERLKEALRTMRDAKTPFLATPERFGHAYDGISRYDEWAG